MSEQGASLMPSDVLGMLRRFADERGTDIRMMLDPESGRHLLREVARVPSPDEARIYERGGFVPPVPPAILAREAERLREQMVDTCVTHRLRFPMGDTCPRCADAERETSPSTPAAMLAEALEHIRKARRRLFSAVPPDSDKRSDAADKDLGRAEGAVRFLHGVASAKDEQVERESEAREGQPVEARCMRCKQLVSAHRVEFRGVVCPEGRG